MKHFLRIVLLALCLTGCRAPGHIGEGEGSKLSIGMPEAEVYRKLGRPESVSKEGNVQIIDYTVEGPWGRRSKFVARWRVNPRHWVPAASSQTSSCRRRNPVGPSVARYFKYNSVLCPRALARLSHSLLFF
jgi:hypothetical protein